jgi:hypothetical protein
MHGLQNEVPKVQLLAPTATQEILKADSRVHKRRPLVPVLSQMNPAITLAFFFKLTLILFADLHPVLLSSGFLTKTYITLR